MTKEYAKHETLLINQLYLGDNYRKNFSKKKLKGLAESIKHNGLIKPLIVLEQDGRYEIVAGQRRYLALKLIHE